MVGCRQKSFNHGHALMMFDSPLGFICYLFLPNDYVWGLMNSKERARVLAANRVHNVSRVDYADPNLYQGGNSFDSNEDRMAKYRGRVLQRYLDEEQPSHVIEIGPGSGFYTRQIVDHPAVTEYTAIDINVAFLSFLQSRLMAHRKPNGAKVSATIVEADMSSSPPKLHGDSVVLLSSAHHLPNRGEILASCATMLRPGGSILAIDPAHYWPRVRALMVKCRDEGYLKKSYRETLTNISTHHFCTEAEYRRICRRHPQLAISWTDFFTGEHRVDWWKAVEMAVKLTIGGGEEVGTPIEVDHT